MTPVMFWTAFWIILGLWLGACYLWGLYMAVRLWTGRHPWALLRGRSSRKTRRGRALVTATASSPPVMAKSRKQAVADTEAA